MTLKGLTKEQIELEKKGYIFSLNNEGKMYMEETELSKRNEKKEAIDKIASISDQLNLIAGTLDVLVDVLSDDYPIILEHPYVIASKIKLNEIKAILNK